MPSKIPEGIKCGITPEQAYPDGLPEIPDGYEFAHFRPVAMIAEIFLDEEGHICHAGTNSIKGMPRIILRRNPEPEPPSEMEPPRHGYNKFEESLAIQAATKIGLLAPDQYLAAKDMDYIVGRWRAIDKAAILAADIAPTYRLPLPVKLREGCPECGRMKPCHEKGCSRDVPMAEFSQTHPPEKDATAKRQMIHPLDAGKGFPPHDYNNDDCERHGCIPYVEPTKPRRWLVEIESDKKPEYVTVYSLYFVMLRHVVIDVREVKPITRERVMEAVSEAVARLNPNGANYLLHGFKIALRELGIEVED